jgi:adenylate kinase
MSLGRGPPRIIIAGAPASGKGTQCEFIKEEWGCVHLSTGDMLRAAVAAGTPTGLKAKGYMDSGQLVPDEVIIGVIIDRLAETDCVERGWLLDGFPRTRAQADALSAAGLVCDVFVLLDVPDSLLVERVCGRRSDPETGKIYHIKYSPPESAEVAARLTQRSDDTEEAISVRIAAFHKNLGAIMDVYSSCTVRVEGSRKPAEVWNDIKGGVSSFLHSM